MSLSDSTGNLIDEVTKLFRTRVSSKFGGSFCLFWIACNWEFLYFLMMSDKPVESKLNYIDIHFLDIKDVFVLPFGLTLVYVVLFPAVSEAVEAAWNIIQSNIRIRGQLKVEGTVPISPQKKNALLQLIANTKATHVAEIQEKDEQISALQLLIMDETGKAPQVATRKKSESNIKKNENLRINEKEFKEQCLTLLETSNGRFILEDWLAKLFKLNKDHKTHRVELNTLYATMDSLLRAYPNTWKPKSLSSLDPYQKVNIAEVAVEGAALKLFSNGYIEAQADGLDAMYALTDKAILAMNELYLKVSD
jgi:hypothetical protein